MRWKRRYRISMRIMQLLRLVHPGSNRGKECCFSAKKSEAIKMNMTNEFIEDLFLAHMKDLTARTNRNMRSIDMQFSGKITARRQ
jgi:hypothetical protein